MIRNGPFSTASKHEMKRCWSLLDLRIIHTKGIFQHVNGTYHPILPLSLENPVHSNSMVKKNPEMMHKRVEIGKSFLRGIKVGLV